MTENYPWLKIHRGTAPLVVSFPHTGTDIPASYQSGLHSLWLARRDCDWWIERLYDFAAALGATTIRTAISRTIIDVNRDPSGVSLYPGQATTELCPTTTFDGDPLYKAGMTPDTDEIERRRALYFDPYHAALSEEIRRLRAAHPHVVVYDCHSIRSVIPRLFEGELPHFNIGTNSGLSCDERLQNMIVARCHAAESMHTVINGRFKGGYITRHHANPAHGVHAVQMELACRGYMHEPIPDVTEKNWPSAYDAEYAASIRKTLAFILEDCLSFAGNGQR